MKSWRNRVIIFGVLVCMLSLGWQCVFAAEAGKTCEVLSREERCKLRVLPDAEKTVTSMLPAKSSARVFEQCFGNQLTGYSRQMYDGLVSWYVTSRKTGTYVHTFQEYPTCKYTGKQENYEKASSFRKLMSQLTADAKNAIDAFTYDYPEVFWVSGWSYGSRNMVLTGSSSKHTIYVRQYEFETTAIGSLSSKVSAFDQQVLAAMNTIRSMPGSGYSRYHLVRAIHDYLCEQLVYSEADGLASHTAAAAFAGSKRAVCEGYAKAFKVLCDQAGIPCVCVMGPAGASSDSMELHMWNYVRMSNGKWYLVDTTWDDTDREDVVDDIYYLKGSSSEGGYGISISSERTENGYFSEPYYMAFSYPALSREAFVFSCGGGHVSVKDPAVQPTCTKTGKTEGSHCTVCGDVIVAQRTVPKLGHNTVSVPAKEATCTKAGYTAGKICTVCGRYVSGHKKIKPLGHKWGKWTIVIPASFRSKGKEQRVCAHDSTHIECRTTPKEKCAVKVMPASVKTKAKKNKVIVSWGKIRAKNRKKLKSVKAVEVQYSRERSFRNAQTKKTGKTKTRLTLKGLEKGTWYVRVRYCSGKGVSKWSKVKKARVSGTG